MPVCWPSLLDDFQANERHCLKKQVDSNWGMTPEGVFWPQQHAHTCSHPPTYACAPAHTHIHKHSCAAVPSILVPSPADVRNYPGKSNLMEKGSISPFSSVGQWMMAGESGIWHWKQLFPVTSTSRKQGTINACRYSVPFLRLWSPGGGAAHSRQVFPPQLVQSRWSPRGQVTLDSVLLAVNMTSHTGTNRSSGITRPCTWQASVLPLT